MRLTYAATPHAPIYPLWMDLATGTVRQKTATPNTTAFAAPAAPRSSTSIVRSLFSVHTPNEITKMHNSESFSERPFIDDEKEDRNQPHGK